MPEGGGGEEEEPSRKTGFRNPARRTNSAGQPASKESFAQAHQGRGAAEGISPFPTMQRKRARSHILYA